MIQTYPAQSQEVAFQAEWHEQNFAVWNYRNIWGRLSNLVWKVGGITLACIKLRCRRGWVHRLGCCTPSCCYCKFSLLCIYLISPLTAPCSHSSLHHTDSHAVYQISLLTHLCSFNVNFCSLPFGLQFILSGMMPYILPCFSLLKTQHLHLNVQFRLIAPLASRSLGLAVLLSAGLFLGFYYVLVPFPPKWNPGGHSPSQSTTTVTVSCLLTVPLWTCVKMSLQCWPKEGPMG